MAWSGQTNAFPCCSTNESLSSAERFWYLQLLNFVLIRIFAALMLEMMLMDAHSKRNIVLARRVKIRTPIRNITFEVIKTECPVPGPFSSPPLTELAEIFTAPEQDVL